MSIDRLIQTFALANDFKEGDLLIGGTRDDQLRSEARAEIASLNIGEINNSAFVDDGVTEILHRSVDSNLTAGIKHLTVAELKRILLGSNCTAWVAGHSDGLSSEVIAAVAKLMTDEELGKVSRTLFNPLPGSAVAIGSPQHFGSRIQPNSPGDDETEILFSILEGLTYGCGDVIIGLNPASDDIDTIVHLEDLLCRVVQRLKLPTRYSVLSDIVKQTSARARTAVDVGFQSLAGTSKALVGMVGLDIEGLLDLARGFDGLYFETGQGSAVTNQAAAGIDMVTLESRAYGIARYIRKRTGAWMIVNDVAGFIGPEVFQTGDQLRRACLEDTMMAKLHGITMGLDVCATFHMGISPQELRRLTEEIVSLAAPAYLMAVAGNSDPMLGYLTTSFEEHPELRRRTGRQISTVMKNRLVELGVMDQSGEIKGSGIESLYAQYQRAAGDTRSIDSLRQEATKKIDILADRGFYIGARSKSTLGKPGNSPSRIDELYNHARRALYAKLDAAVIRDVATHHIRVRTQSHSREDYLVHPSAGESICDEDVARIGALYPEGRPLVQVVISDGLNANALNENLRIVLPSFRKLVIQNGYRLGDIDIVMDNARVRAGYHVGSLLDVEVVVHFIGERPGTGINTLSVYVTYGRDETGQSRWSRSMDHSLTTAVCGIHRRGKKPEVASEELANVVNRIFEQRCSGVKLR
jgi:ethanolamine ammonia-lyase large subunit